MDIQLNNRTALVTGSTQGIGYEIARHLMKEGATVFINGREGERVRQVVEDLSSEGTALAAPGDISSSEEVDDIIDRVQDHGPLDILINNAGIFEVKEFQEISDDEWQEYFNTNVMGAVRLSRAFLPEMIDRDWGRIIMVASEAGVKPIPFFLHYSVSKTAMLGLARGLAELTKGTDVTVNSLLPGPTKSEGLMEFFKGVAEQEGSSVEEVMDGYFEEEEPTSLLQRFEKPEEIATVATFLCSEEAVVINGTAQRADGGLIRSIL